MTNTNPSPVPIPAGSMATLGRLLARISQQLTDTPWKEGVVLVDELAAAALHLDDPYHPDGIASTETRWKHTTATDGKLWRTFFGDGPEIHIGRVEMLDQLDEMEWPFNTSYWDMLTALAEWQHITGHAWSQLSGAMGIELVRRTMGKWRIPGQRGDHAYTEIDDCPVVSDEA